nr:serine hydroxymethyltransferase [Acidimicrobiia bacterium]
DDASFTAASGIRMGAQEMTRYGMREADFADLARLIAAIATEGGAKPEGHWRDQVVEMRSRFRAMRYAL